MQQEPLDQLDQSTLDTIIAKHKLFQQGRAGGLRAQVTHRDLSHLVLRECDLSHADFTGSTFFESDLAYAKLDYCQFYACDMRRANMRGASLVRADLRGARLRGASLTGANLSDADLRAGSFATYDSKSGVHFTNRGTAWIENSGVVDLRGVSLASANLSGVVATNSNFEDADLQKATFIHGDLSGANLSGANLSGADLSLCVMKNVILRSAVLIGTVVDPTNLINADMTGALTDKPAGKTLDQLPLSLEEMLKTHKRWLNTRGSQGQRLDLSGFDLRTILPLTKEDLTMIISEHAIWYGQNLSYADIQAAQFRFSDMRYCNFEAADLRGTDFMKATLTGAQFNKVHLEPLLLENKRYLKSNFSGAALCYADFRDASLRDVDFSNADLSFADFTGADVKGANFNNAILEEAKYDSPIKN
jgi:uncharacterized protein YjbI with pentapeptide repeats